MGRSVGPSPAPLELGLSRGHEQRPVQSYCPGLAFKGTGVARAILPSPGAHGP